MAKKYSVIIPVYNRPIEVDELLESLAQQSFKDFEILIVEDGSTEDCRAVIQQYEDKLDILYFFKENTGPGASRNYGMARANGEYLVFFDSDCIIPPHYFEAVETRLKQNPVGAYGGPDNAHPSFTTVQKAINYSMTSVITTGGVRGKENKLDNYQPRTFNMGISKEAYEKVGDFTDLHPGEDPDLSYRIMNAGYSIALIPDAFVYHKRRIDFRKFTQQVYKFGVVRNILMKWYPDKFKPVYLLPAMFLLGSLGLAILAVMSSWLFLLPLILLAVTLLLHALFTTGNLVISLLAVPASFIQLYGYGYGFIKGFVNIHIFKRKERVAFKSFFFKERG